MARIATGGLFLCLHLIVAGAAEQEKGQTDTLLAEMPEGYHVQTYDDCGEPGRMPHVPKDVPRYRFTNVDGDAEAQTISNGTPDFKMIFDGLDARVPYVAAVTYAGQKGNPRVQSLAAGSVQLHGPRQLPDGKVERIFLRIPALAIRDGRLELHFILNRGHNAVVSAVELWAPLPSPKVLNLELVPRVTGKLTGRALNIAYKGVAGAEVFVRNATSGEELSRFAAGQDGSFQFDLSKSISPGSKGTLEVAVKQGGLEAKGSVPFADLCFVPPRFRPMAEEVAGLETSIVLLDGTWRIRANPPKVFQTQPTGGTEWSDFQVPGQWLQQGFDIATDKVVGVATDFVIPESFRGKRLFLRFDAVHGGAHYWLAGHDLGYSENLYTPVEFDVTGLTLPGQRNHLALTIKVDTPSETASHASGYAFHNLGGIDRSVRLFALPDVHFADLGCETLLDAAYRNATLVLSVAIDNTRPTAVSDLSLRITLTDPRGKAVDLPQREFALGQISPGEHLESKRIAVSDPLKWSAEKPHLYVLKVELCQGRDLLERVNRNVGFRTIEVKDSQLRLNGKRIKLSGVNRHEIDPLTGRAATAIHAQEDARLLREANFNYVRTSHYPPTREFLDACDRLGLYIECEAPYCWTRGGRGEDDPRETKSFLTATAAMLRYHGEHPSVILWSLANESGSGPDGPNRLPENFAATLEFCRRQDASRPVLFNNEWNRDGAACDVSVLHYAAVGLDDNPLIKDDPRPVLLDEYFPPQTFVFAEELKLNPGLDIVNWSLGQNSPNSHWSRLYESTRAAGGAIWAGIDEEFYFRDGTVKGYGPWGFLDVWRRPKSLWWDAKRIHAPVWIPVRRLDYDPGQAVLRVPVENRYAFTDLSELKTSWEIGSLNGSCRVSLPPGGKGEIEVPLPQNLTPGSLLVLRFFDPQGGLVNAHGITVGTAPSPPLPKPRAGCPSWKDDGKIITIQADDFQIRLVRRSGRMLPDPAGRSVPLLGLPMPFLTRQETRNPFNPGGLPYAQYPDEASRTIDDLSVEQRGPALAITLSDHFDNLRGSLKILLDKAGVASVSFDYVYSGEPLLRSEVGLRFLFDKRCAEIGWRRNAHWDVYPPDHIGRPEGRAHARTSQAETKVSFPPFRSRPGWPWHLDQNEFGTRDFRAAKYSIYQAELVGPDGSGIRVYSDGSTDVRANLAPDGVQFHLLLGREASPPRNVATGDRLAGSFAIQLLPASNRN